MKQKVKEWKKRKDEAKKKYDTVSASGSTHKQNKPAELETAKTKQTEIEAAMPVYEVQ